MFYVAAAINVVSCLVFLIFCTGEVLDWVKPYMQDDVGELAVDKPETLALKSPEKPDIVVNGAGETTPLQSIHDVDA